MKTAIITLYIVFVGALFYSNYSYMQYQNLWPRRDPVGLLTGLRAWFGFARDLNDNNLSDECRMHFKRFKIAAIVAALTAIVFILFILSVRLF
jgi:hypothetical protein